MSRHNILEAHMFYLFPQTSSICYSLMFVQINVDNLTLPPIISPLFTAVSSIYEYVCTSYIIYPSNTIGSTYVHMHQPCTMCMEGYVDILVHQVPPILKSSITRILGNCSASHISHLHLSSHKALIFKYHFSECIRLCKQH